MYLEHFGLKEPPFSITPDPRFVFLSERHRDALAHLLFGIGQGGGGGFVQLTGEVGTGKTTLSRLLLEQIPDNTRVALVLNPRLSPVELLETICDELLVDHGQASEHGSVKSLTDRLNVYLLDAYAQGLRVVLIIDEAQNLSIEALEQVRLLTNLETDTQKLLQIILLGQPELRTLLARPDLRQLAQRITARYHLTPLDSEETAAYLRHRFRVAGGLHLPFDATAIRRIHAHSGGVPRLINVIAERALLGGYAQDQTRIGARTVDRAAREALAPRPSRWRRRWFAPVAAGVGALALMAAVYEWKAPAPIAPAEAVEPAPAAAAPDSVVEAPTEPAIERVDADALAARIAESEPSSRTAWSQLLELWELPTDAASVDRAAQCPLAITAGTYCLHTRASLDRLVAQDRPALLRLRSGTHERWAMLLGADATHARLSLDGQEIDVERIALARFWNGEHATVWRGPDPLPLPWTGDAAASEWVRARLVPRYLSADAGAATASELQAAVRRFQGDRGLLSDGLIGPETLAALAAMDDGGPHLRKGLE